MARRRSRGQSRGGTHFLFRILLFPAAAAYYFLLSYLDIGTLKFAEAFRSASFSEYGLNYVVLALCCAGWIMLLFASPRRKVLASAAMILIGTPVWLHPYITSFRGSAGTMAIGSISFEKWPYLAALAAMSLWGMPMVRGRGAEYGKWALGLLLLARTGLMVFYGDVYRLFWFDDTYMLSVALLLGAVTDAVYCGPSLYDLFVPLTAWAWVILCLSLNWISLSVGLYLTIGLSLVGITALVCTHAFRRNYSGYILCFLACGLNTVSAMMANGIIRF